MCGRSGRSALRYAASLLALRTYSRPCGAVDTKPCSMLRATGAWLSGGMQVVMPRPARAYRNAITIVALVGNNRLGVWQHWIDQSRALMVTHLSFCEKKDNWPAGSGRYRLARMCVQRGRPDDGVGTAQVEIFGHSGRISEPGRLCRPRRSAARLHSQQSPIATLFIPGDGKSPNACVGP